MEESIVSISWLMLPTSHFSWQGILDTVFATVMIRILAPSARLTLQIVPALYDVLADDAITWTCFLQRHASLVNNKKCPLLSFAPHDSDRMRAQLTATSTHACHPPTHIFSILARNPFSRQAIINRPQLVTRTLPAKYFALETPKRLTKEAASSSLLPA